MIISIANSRKIACGIAGFVGLCLFAGPSPAQLTPDQSAALVLNSARRAYNDKNYLFAAERFREFLAKHGNHKEAPSARYGLALALLASPKRNDNEVRDLLQAAASDKALPERAQVLFHLGVALRRLGFEELNIADAKPPEAGKRREAAQKLFEEARARFAEAMTAFPPRAEKAPAVLEWASRARCYQAEMLLRLQKHKDAREITAGFLDDPVLNASRYRDLGRYYHGYSAFLLKDYAAAKAVLARLTPFSDPTFGLHARYLLARSNHLLGDRAEARLHYQRVLDDNAKAKNTIPADHALRSSFYLGVLLYEEGQIAEARQRFAEFAKTYPNAPLRADGDLRLGVCLVQQKDFADAIKILTPLADKERRLSDQAMFWLAKAQMATAPDSQKDPAGHQKTLTQAQTTLRQAAERAQQLAGGDPEAPFRRGDMLLELAEVQQRLKQPKDVINTYAQILKEKLLPQREEELLLRRLTALSLAGDAGESDKVAAEFIKKFPESKNMPAVLFRLAENSFGRMLANEKNAKELPKLQEETIKLYQSIAEKFPQSPYGNLARYGVGLTYYRKGDLDKARKILESIPQPERHGELALASYLLAECLLQSAPKAVSEDSAEAAKLQDLLLKAAELLKSFADSQPRGPQSIDALLKLGSCQQRLAKLVPSREKTNALTAARSAYDMILADSAAQAQHPQAILERARCLAQMDDVAGAMQALQRFTETFKNTALAPVGIVELAKLVREQKKPAEAVAILAKARQQLEPVLSKDPQRASSLPLLRYHHGLALREAGNLAEARSLFDQVFKQSPNSPEAGDATVRFGQCLKEEGQAKLEQARAAQARAKKPEEVTAAAKLQGEGYKFISDAVQFLESQAPQWKPKPGQAAARMHYEAAWANRILADRDVETARAGKVQELMKKLGPAAGKLSSADVPLTAVPLQVSETKARTQYQALIDGFPDLPLANDARLELSELYVQRHEYEPAMKLSKDGLDRDPSAELSDRLRLRLADVYAAKGDHKAALAQFDSVARQSNGRHLGQALYRAGEYLMHQKQWADAIKRLEKFRTEAPLRKLPGLTDSALLRLGQSYAQVEKWPESRAVLEGVLSAFPDSPVADDARYGIGWAWQHQKEYDKAATAYNQVLPSPTAALAARAQLQIGLCRLSQHRHSEAANALLVVPFIHDYPELSAAALLEAARAFSAMKQKEQAIRLLERLLQDRALSAWAEIARERLHELRKTTETAGFPNF